MQTPAVASDFLHLVVRSGLVSESRLDAACEELDITPEMDAERAARRDASSTGGPAPEATTETEET